MRYEDRDGDLPGGGDDNIIRYKPPVEGGNGAGGGASSGNMVQIRQARAQYDNKFTSGKVEEPIIISTTSSSKVAVPYKRPSGSVTPEQRKSVQGKPCVTCGKTESKMVADHKKPLVEEYYETGTIDKKKMRDVNSVQPQCPTCSAKQGAEMTKYSKEQKKKHGIK